MPRRKDLHLDGYGISKFAYRELCNFCLQYEDKKAKVAELRNPYNSPQITGLPHGNEVGNPTESAAEKAAVMSHDIDLIETAVRAAAPDIYSTLLKNVTQGIQYDYMEVPAGRRQFYEKRRKFFYILAQKRGII